MKVYLALVEEHTFDNRWDSFSRHRIFANRDDACSWVDKTAQNVAEKYDAEVVDVFPSYIDDDMDAFVWTSVTEEEVY